MSEITRILEAVDRGEARASAELVPLVYQELRRLAAWKLAREAPGQTLQPTGLVASGIREDSQLMSVQIPHVSLLGQQRTHN
jgi:ECF sigma factor